MAHCLSSTEDNEEAEEEEHFPTALLNDGVCIKEPVLDRQLWILEDSQHDLCLYLCPYSLDPLHLALDYAPRYMDLSDIFNFQDVITTSSDEDITNL